MAGRKDASDTPAPSALALKGLPPHTVSVLKPTKVEALSGYRLHLTYPDGTEGIIDLSVDVGRGVFAPLADEAYFRTVHIGKYGQIAWSEDIEICSDSAYEEIVSRPAEGSHARG
jgi:hypothetical protein